jgi:hypothetical protein
MSVIILLLVHFLCSFVPAAYAQRIVVTDSYPITEDGISYYPAWNQTHSSEKLYFTSHQNGSSWRLSSYDFLERNVSLEGLKDNCLFPSVSPNGSMIAYNSIDIINENASEFSLYYWDLLSNSTRRATDPSFGSAQGVLTSTMPNPYTRPSWKPANSEVFLSGWSNIFQSYVLWSVSFDRSRSEVTFENRWDVEAAVSPDGTKIAVCSWMSGAFEIWVSNLDGSDPAQLTFSGNGQIYNNEPCWSPDGKYIAFVSNRNGNEDIWYMTSDGADQSVLVGSPFPEFYPSWSPDGNKIAYCKNVNGAVDIWIANIFVYASKIECHVPSSMVLEWNNTMNISIANNDSFDYNFTLRVSGDAFQPGIVENVFVESQKPWAKEYTLSPNKEGNRTLKVEFFDGTQNIFTEYYRVEISKPAELIALPENISRECIPGTMIYAGITLIDYSGEEARNVALYLVGDLRNLTDLSDYGFKTIEAHGGYVKVDIVVDVPKATYLQNEIAGQIVVNGTNFKTLTIPLDIVLKEEQPSPETQAASITGTYAVVAAVIAAAISGIIGGVVSILAVRHTRALKKDIKDLREAIKNLVTELHKNAS